jgi:tetratricopeptide (TPR) repeat protein
MAKNYTNIKRGLTHREIPGYSFSDHKETLPGGIILMRTIHVLLLAGLLISSLPGLAWSNSAPVANNTATAEPSARPPRRLVVSILWFEDKTGNPQAAHWRYGIEGMLSNGFWQIKSIRLRRGVEFARKRLGIAKGAALNADQARKMGEIIEAQRVIWGSFRRQGDKWQVTAQVLNVASGKASADLTADSADFFGVCDNLIGRIFKELDVTPSDAERKKMERPLTSSITALEWYSKAYALQGEGEPISEQEECARKAIAADPNFAAAHLSLAAALASQGKFEPAEKAVRQALKIRPDVAYAHTTLGVILLFQKRYVEGEKELREAHRLDPDYAEPLDRLGQLYQVQGKLDEAIDAFNKAIVLKPMDASIHAGLAFACARKGDRDQALEELKKAEQLNSGGLENVNAEQTICQAYDRLGVIPLALIHYERFIMLAKKQGANPEAIRHFEERATKLKSILPVTFVDDPMPKIYTGPMLQEALEKKLTREELEMVVNPIAGSPEIRRWALQLTERAENDLGKARAIFDGLARRSSFRNMRGMRTAQEVFAAYDDPNESFSCQEFAKLYIVMARDAGLKAFFTIVEKDRYGRAINHACAAVFVDGKTLLVDLSYCWFGVPHKKFVIMDDMQMITIQLCEAANTEPNRSLSRLALKLRPDIPISQFVLAMALASAEEWQEARRMTEAARQVEPEHWIAYSMQGRLAQEDGDLAAAASCFRKASAINPDNADCRYSLGSVLMAQFKLEEARDELRAGLQCNPEHSWAKYARRTIALINESVGDEMVQVPEDPNIYLLRASRYMKEGSYDQAIGQFNEALALDANHAEAYVLRGMAYIDKADYDRAIADCTKALEIEPELDKAYYGRGKAYVEKQQYDQAILDFTKAIELNPKRAEGYLARGTLYWLKTIDRAIAYRTKALEIQPELDKVDYDHAIADFTKALEIGPENAEAYDQRGFVYFQRQQYDQAILDLTKVIELDPERAKAYSFRGTAYAMKGNYERARVDFNKTNELDPRIARTYYYWRGLTYLKTGDDDRAISDFNKVLGRNRQDTKAIVGLATAVMNKGMHKLAIALSNRAIEIDPQFAAAYDVRARASYKNEQFEKSQVDSIPNVGQHLLSANDPNLVAYWPLNGDPNDHSSNRNHGIIKGEVILTKDRLGNPNSAYRFNGNGHICIPDNEEFTLGSHPFTISVWMQFSALGSYFMMGHDEGPGATNKWILWPHRSGVTFHVYDANLHSKGRFDPITYSEWDPDINVWYHLAIVRDDVSYSLYVDGLQVYYVRHDKRTIPNPDAPLILGDAELKLSNYRFRGVLDDIRIYNRALSSGEINLLMEADEE